MNVLDFIVLILAAAGFLIGIFKGIIKQVLTIIGIFVVSTLTATVTPYVQNWLTNTSMSQNTQTVVAMIASVLLLGVAYALVAVLLVKLLHNITIIKVLDRVIGGVLGFAAVYLSFAVIFALFNSTADWFMPMLKSLLGDTFRDSWVAQHLFAKNPFGNWVVVSIAQKLLEKLAPVAPNAIFIC